MSQVQRTTGVIVPLRAELEAVAAQVARWQSGEVDDASLGMLVERVTRKVRTACWCAAGVCCAPHDRHVSPHQHCILR